ncbi:MAG: FAD-dependent oxidoreductase, partial [archaeon]
MAESKNSGAWDLVIIGGGCAGFGGAIYAARFQLKTIVLAKQRGGTITTTHLVENYPGFVRLSGLELAKNLEDHVKSYNVPIKDEEAEEISRKNGLFAVKTGEGEYLAKTILIATGTGHRKLNVPGEKEFENKGVSYCATCDAPLFRGKTVAVVGGSDSAAKEALLLSEYAKKVYLIYRGKQIHPEPINALRVSQNKKIEIIANTNVLEVKGSKLLEKAVLDKPYNGKNELELQGLFVEIGADPISAIAKGIGVKTNPKGEIIIDRNSS